MTVLTTASAFWAYEGHGPYCGLSGGHGGNCLNCKITRQLETNASTATTKEKVLYKTGRKASSDTQRILKCSQGATNKTLVPSVWIVKNPQAAMTWAATWQRLAGYRPASSVFQCHLRPSPASIKSIMIGKWRSMVLQLLECPFLDIFGSLNNSCGLHDANGMWLSKIW